MKSFIFGAITGAVVATGTLYVLGRRWEAKEEAERAAKLKATKPETNEGLGVVGRTTCDVFVALTGKIAEHVADKAENDKKSAGEFKPTLSRHAEAKKVFEACYVDLPVLECKPEWHNSTGYFNGVVADQALADSMTEGQQYASQDEHGRKLIITKTGIGLIVVFQRYSSENSGYTFNSDSRIERLFNIDSGMLNAEALANIVGCKNADFGLYHNVGERLANVGNDK